MTVAVIAEFDPPHSGHAALARAIRSSFGEDCTLVAVMSGNYTQRGEPAILSKDLRARAALSAGFDLILELPFPWCAASAGYFADAGVHIAAAIGADVLAFGSECGDLPLLTRVAERVGSPAFRDLLSASSGNGYARSAAELYDKTYPSDAPFPTAPNDILAVCYLDAIRKSGASLSPFAYRRGGDHHGQALGGAFASASAIRAAIREDRLSDVLPYLSAETAAVLTSAIRDGRCPADLDRIGTAVLSYLRLNPSPRFQPTDGDLYNRLVRASRKATDLATLTEAVRTRSYTDSGIRRAILHSFFGVTSPVLKEMPGYTQLLAANERGTALVRKTARSGAFPILTKPTDRDKLLPDAQKQKALFDAADGIYALTLPVAGTAASVLSYTPAIEKSADGAKS